MEEKRSEKEKEEERERKKREGGGRKNGELGRREKRIQLTIPLKSYGNADG